MLLSVIRLMFLITIDQKASVEHIEQYQLNLNNSLSLIDVNIFLPWLKAIPA